MVDQEKGLTDGRNLQAPASGEKRLEVRRQYFSKRGPETIASESPKVLI